MHRCLFAAEILQRLWRFFKVQSYFLAFCFSMLHRGACVHAGW